MILRTKLNKVLAAVSAALLFTFASVPSFAGQGATGTIHHIIVTTGGVVLFDHTGARTGLPTCGQANSIRWAFNGATAEGQAKLSLLLTAYSTGKPVIIYGAGTCAIWGDTEDVVFIATND